ncbi:MAG: PepSY domain-containing protein [Caulobacteraceae bacterium]
MAFKDRLKKFAAPLLAATVVFTGVASYGVTNAFAASTPVPSAPSTVSQEVKGRTPDYQASITLGQQDNSVDESKGNENEAKDDAALASKAKISKEDAINAAKAAYPEYSVKNADLGDENGNLVYEVKMSDKAGTILEVKVDAGNANILAADKDNEEEKDALGNEKADTQDKESGSEIDTDNVEEEVEE